MPDMKYGDQAAAKRLSGIDYYPQINREAVKEMHRQVGDLKTDANGVAVRGLLIRHLVLPNGLAGTEAVCQFLSEEVSLDTYLNVMAQYRLCYRAGEFPELARPITSAEYAEAVDIARSQGLRRLDRVEDRLARVRWIE
jgi:putative pyruvate formate lyase activating enzyme